MKYNHTSPRRLRVQSMLVCALSIVLSACAVGPNYPNSSEQVTLDTQWHAQLPHEGDAQSVLNWWAQFDDAALTRLQRLAQANNQSLEMARARMMQARANAGVASGAQLPSLNAVGNAARTNGTDGSDVIRTNMTGVLDAAWELDLWGGVRANRQSADALADASVYDWAATKVSVGAEIASTYTAYRACEQQFALMGQDIDSRAKSVELTRLLVNAGFTAPAEGALSDAAMANARQTWFNYKAQCAVLKKSLTVLAGVTESELSSAMGINNPQDVLHAIPHAPAFTLNQLPVQLVSQRPDVAAAERRLFAANRRITVAQAQRFPRLSLLGSLSLFGVRLSGQSSTAQSDSWSFGPSLTLPLFNAGQLQSASEAARAQYDETLAAYKLSVQNAVREVETALVQLDSVQNRLKQARIAQSNMQKFLTASVVRHDSGMLSLLELEDARRSALNAQQALINTEQEYTVQWINLYKALGGQWREGIDAAPAPQSTP